MGEAFLPSKQWEMQKLIDAQDAENKWQTSAQP